MRKNAKVILMRCKQTGKLSGIRMEERSDGWYYTWAFPIKEASAANEGYASTKISGKFHRGAGYRGCPYCGNTGYVKCGKCNRLTCWDDQTYFHCQWCGNEGTISGTIKELDAGQDH